MLETTSGLRLLGEICLRCWSFWRNPVVNVFADYRSRITALDPCWLCGEMWGYHENGRLVSACHSGANLVPVEATPTALEFSRTGLWTSIGGARRSWDRLIR